VCLELGRKAKGVREDKGETGLIVLVRYGYSKNPSSHRETPWHISKTGRRF
jgi:hypothetical protein